ncbi:MAG: CDP-alcohol phosphatidyltransferase family protein [Pyrinomonadaceae bacterium]
MKIKSQSVAYLDHHVITSFGFTALRIGVAISVGVAFLFVGVEQSKVFAVLGALVIIAFDYFDGKFFNASPVAEEKSWRILRRKTDSVADRLVIQLVCIPLLVTDFSFIWVYSAILLREVVISGYNVSLYKRGILVYPKAVAKIACAFVGLSGISYLLLSPLPTFFVTAAMMVLSGYALMEYKKRVPDAGLVLSEKYDLPVEVF